MCFRIANCHYGDIVGEKEIELGIRRIAKRGGDCRQMLDFLSRVRENLKDEEDDGEFNVMGIGGTTSVIKEPVESILAEHHSTETDRLVKSIGLMPLVQQVRKGKGRVVIGAACCRQF